jgi:gluconate 2-dehydrogenase gamma chain
MSRPSRRQFLYGTGSLGLVLAGGGLLGERLGGREARGTPALVSPAGARTLIAPPENLRTLAMSEYFALAAACERIFPRDDTPGALDLGVPQYVDGAFGARPLPPWTEGLRAGLARLDRQATRDFAAPFYHLGARDQDALLTSWETDVDADNASFVRNLIVATLEGAFAAPAYGGNRDAAGWSSLGFPIDPFPPATGAP